MRNHLRTVAALSLLTLGACGSGAATDAAGAPDSVPFASTTASSPVSATSALTTPVSSSTMDEAAASGTGTDPATGSAGGAPTGSEVSVELIKSMLSTDEGRALIAETMAQQSGITQEQAVCFLENIDAETMVALSELGASGSTPDPSALPDTALGDLMDAVSGCGIDPAALLG